MVPFVPFLGIRMPCRAMEDFRDLPLQALHQSDLCQPCMQTLRISLPCAAAPPAERAAGSWAAAGHTFPDAQKAFQTLTSRCLRDAAARLLKAREAAGRLRGTVRLLFQPAEEGGAGARAMLAEGALAGVTGAHAIHVWPGLPSGTVASRVGTRWTNAGGANNCPSYFAHLWPGLPWERWPVRCTSAILSMAIPHATPCRPRVSEMLAVRLVRPF